MSTTAIVQARMTSRRFPGKVLATLEGRPMILAQLARLARAKKIDRIVVAISHEPSDDPLAEVITGAGYQLHRGPLDDVLARFIGASQATDADVIVRITADCPLLSPTVIDRVITEFERASVDYASNTLQPTYPDGLDVEVVRASALEELAEQQLDSDEREHVTLGVYRRPEMFTLHSVMDPRADRSDLRWTVDTPEDLQFVEWIYRALEPVNPDFDYRDIVALLDKHPDRSRTTEHGLRNAALLGKDTGAMRGPTTGPES